MVQNWYHSTEDASSAWIVEALPQAGTVSACLTIMTDSDIMEYTLTLAPPIKGISPAKADFAVFQKDSGVAAPSVIFRRWQA
jgi:hypothetical protein